MNLATVLSILMKVVSIGSGVLGTLGYLNSSQASTGSTALEGIIAGVGALASVYHSVVTNTPVAVVNKGIAAGVINPVSGQVSAGVLPNAVKR